MCGEKKNILYWVTRAAKAGLKSLVSAHDETNEPTKEGPLSFVHFESPFTSVSTVSRGHPSLVRRLYLSFIILSVSMPAVEVNKSYREELVKTVYWQ